MSGALISWRYEADLNTHVIREDRGGDEFDGYIASTWGGVNEERARLIAAAPELLEALKRVEFCLRGYTDSSKRECRLDDIRAAIAKATGGAA